jgi:acyl-[acyl-carrier-protein] desaturase
MHSSRLEIMKHLEPFVDAQLPTLLRDIDRLWQPSDFLPDFTAEDAIQQVGELQEEARRLPDDVLNSLVGDTITEEALPTYAQWLSSLEGVGGMGCDTSNPWAAWNRAWCGEENRHGDTLAAYLRLSGRVRMREIEIAVNNLIYDGMDIQTGTDPYRFFVYTSFQELATLRSHRSVGRLAQAAGATRLDRMSRVIAGDEGWHARAYRLFVQKFLELDPAEALPAIEDMLRRKIVMPAMNLRESGAAKGDTFKQFVVLAQRVGVYTAVDYVEIMESLIEEWAIPALSGLTAEAERSQDYICGLPARYRRMIERIMERNPPEKAFRFRWMV